jgi:ribosomal protein S18 acetylase RimI-like enzyme
MTKEEALAYWLAPERESFVAEADGAILGISYIRANQAGGGAHVANAGYMTAPEARGRGVASALCAHSLERARERGFAAMQFNFVVASNTGAIRLWKQHGFEEVGRLPGAFRHPDLGPTDALVLFRTL